MKYRQQWDGEGSFAILANVEANLPALRAVLSDAEENECRKVCSLGNLVGFATWPNECIEMSSSFCVSIAGNIDWMCVGKMGTAGVSSANRQKVIQWTKTEIKAMNSILVQELPTVQICGFCGFFGNLTKDLNLHEPQLTHRFGLAPGRSSSSVWEPYLEDLEGNKLEVQSDVLDLENIDGKILFPGSVSKIGHLGAARYGLVRRNLIELRVVLYDGLEVQHALVQRGLYEEGQLRNMHHNRRRM